MLETPLYQMDTDRHPYALRKGIEKVKTEVSIADYLRAHEVEVKHDRARCIAHGGSNPTSFSVMPDGQHWHCFSCNDGGDVIDLCERVERHIETGTAMVSLAEQFGVELPRRSESWHKWTNEKDRRRDGILDALTGAYQRRFLRVYGGYLEDIENPVERKEEARMFWESLYPVARNAAANRMSR